MLDVNLILLYSKLEKSKRNASKFQQIDRQVNCWIYNKYIFITFFDFAKSNNK